MLQVLPLARPLDDGKLTREGVRTPTSTEGSADLIDEKLHRLFAVAVAVVIAIAIVGVSQSVDYG